MLKRVISAAFAFLFASSETVAETTLVPVSFSPKCGINAKVTIQGSRVDYEVGKGRRTKVGKLTVETEKTLKIDVADYNFDGYTDFAVSHIDDGMGTYSVSYILVYVPKKNQFVSLKPKCGDDFINIKLDKQRRTLTNSYFFNNEMVSCKAKY